VLGGHFHVNGIGGGPIASRSRFAKFHQFFFHGCGDLLFIQAPTELAESFGAVFELFLSHRIGSELLEALVVHFFHALRDLRARGRAIGGLDGSKSDIRGRSGWTTRTRRLLLRWRRRLVVLRWLLLLLLLHRWRLLLKLLLRRRRGLLE